METTALKLRKGFKIGSDPELFITNAEGEFVSPCGLIPGDKSEPYKVDCGAVQRDGMAAEFNTDPAETYEEFEHNIETVVAQMQAMLPSGYKLNAVPSVVFSQKVWDETPDEAKLLGCSPDFDAWNASVNPPPEDLNNPTLRCAGGHLHIGWTGDAGQSVEHVGHCFDLVKQLDGYLGYWSLTQDRDTERRRLYGKAGACRVKPYGVEYRVLSNFWVLDRDVRLQTWNRLVRGISDMRTDYFPNSHLAPLAIQKINESSRYKALENALPFPLVTLEK